MNGNLRMAKKDRTARSLAEYQRQLERFENFNDGAILPDLYTIIRVDGRRAGKSWNEQPRGSYPYADDMIEAFISAGREMFCIGLRCVYAFVHGDEISIVLDPSETSNARRRHKLVSLMASAASVGFLRSVGLPAYFHAKLSELPTREHVEDYFLWQRKVASRNFFSSLLRNELQRRGETFNAIDERLSPLNEVERLSLCREFGFEPTSYDARLRFGVGLHWKTDAQSSPSISVNSTLGDTDEAYLALLRSILQEPGTVCESDPEDVTWSESTSLAPTPQSSPPPASAGRAPFRISGGIPRKRP